MMKNAVFVLVLLSLQTIAIGTGWAQNPISFTVTNRGFDTLRVIVYDDVCHKRLYEGVIGGNATITLNSCPHRRRFGSIRIQNLANGRVRRHSNFMRGARITIP